MYLLVESVTDEWLFEKFINKDRVKILEAHFKDNVRNAIKDTREVCKDERVIGIIDSDLNKFRWRRARLPLFYTDW